MYPCALLHGIIRLLPIMHALCIHTTEIYVLHLQGHGHHHACNLHAL